MVEETIKKEYMLGSDLVNILKQKGEFHYICEFNEYLLYNFKLKEENFKLEISLDISPESRGEIFGEFNKNRYDPSQLSIRKVKVEGAEEILLPEGYVWREVIKTITSKEGGLYRKRSDNYIAIYFECENLEQVEKAISKLPKIQFDLESKVRKEIERLQSL